MSGPRTVV